VGFLLESFEDPALSRLNDVLWIAFAPARTHPTARQIAKSEGCYVHWLSGPNPTQHVTADEQFSPATRVRPQIPQANLFVEKVLGKSQRVQDIAIEHIAWLDWDHQISGLQSSAQFIAFHDFSPRFGAYRSRLGYVAVAAVAKPL
jgi:hypothetical protein